MEESHNWGNNINTSTQNAENTLSPASDVIIPHSSTPPDNKTTKLPSNHTLGIILTVIIIAILGLVTGIITVSINKQNENTQNQSADNTTIEDTAPSTPSLGEQTYENAQQIFTSGAENPYEEATTYFNDLLSNYTDPKDVFDIESIHATILIEHRYYDEALPVVDKLQTLASNDEQLITVYSYYSTIYARTCENADKRKEYDEKIQELINKTEENW